MIKLSQYLHISNEILENLILSLAIFLLLSFCRIFANLIIKRKMPEVKERGRNKFAILSVEAPVCQGTKV